MAAARSISWTAMLGGMGWIAIDWTRRRRRGRLLAETAAGKA
jgi:hypothetical protein